MIDFLLCKRNPPLIFDISSWMRIRKRFGVLGLPCISTDTDPPLSIRKHEEEEEEESKRFQLYPCFGNQNQVFDQVHQTSMKSDLELTFIRGKNGWVCCSDDGDGEKKKKKKQGENTDIPVSKMKEKELKGLKPEEEEKMMARQGGFGWRSTATKNRNAASLGIRCVHFIHLLIRNGICDKKEVKISSDHQQVVLLHERWCEELKGFPLKKKRGSNCEKKVMDAENSKKKWVLHEKDRQVLTEMESRCRRINGRGWRCCQQTVLGFSLCEHHSSLNRASNRPSTATTVARPMKNVVNWVSLEKFEDEDDDEEIVIEEKKRKKMVMVKARSIRSLLGETQHDDYVKV